MNRHTEAEKDAETEETRVTSVQLIHTIKREENPLLLCQEEGFKTRNVLVHANSLIYICSFMQCKMSQTFHTRRNEH